MGTLATVLAGKKIPTPEERYWADVEGDIEDVNMVAVCLSGNIFYLMLRRNLSQQILGPDGCSHKLERA